MAPYGGKRRGGGEGECANYGKERDEDEGGCRGSCEGSGDEGEG